ncbi:MAG: hypothetical protein AABY22_20475 [Nanoarchaeota archaeon]
MKKQEKLDALVYFIELSTRIGYDISPYVGKDLKELDFEHILFLTKLREGEYNSGMKA